MNSFRVLIVDDDEVDRRLVRRALTPMAEVVEALTFDEAVSIAANQTFDCIFVDYRLPGRDGMDLLVELKSTLKLRTSVVMLTGEGNEMVAVEAMKRGAADYLPKSTLSAENLLRVTRQAMEVARLEHELEEARAKLEQQALFDSLTGLGNRNLFMIDLGRKLAAAQRSQEPFSLLMLDLDKFKDANDRYGHQTGDVVLGEVGRRLRSLGRPDDRFYRLGGDEFTAVLNADGPTALLLAERIREAVRVPIVFQDLEIPIGVSIGITTHLGQPATADQLLKRADDAMYEAKRSGAGVISKASDR